MPVYYLKEVNKKKERKRISILCLALVAFLIFTLLSNLVLSCLVARVDYRLYLDPKFMSWISSISQYLVGFPICFLIMRLVPADPMEESDLGPTRFLLFAVISVFLLYSGSILGEEFNTLLSDLLGFVPRDILNESMENMSLVCTFLTSVILAPICEELVFRKFLLDRVNRLGDYPALLLSGFLFGLFHGNFYQFFYAMFIGFLFAYIYLRTGRIRYTIILHMLVNLIFGLVSSGIYQWSEASVMGELAAYVYGGIILALSVLGLVLFLMNFRKATYLKSWLDLREGEWKSIAFLNVGMILMIIACGVEFVLYI